VEEIDRHVKDIYKCSAEILNIQTVESAEEVCRRNGLFVSMKVFI
jgi:hypothetical protein